MTGLPCSHYSRKLSTDEEDDGTRKNYKLFSTNKVLLLDFITQTLKNIWFKINSTFQFIKIYLTNVLFLELINACKVYSISK